MCYGNPAKSLEIARSRLTPEQWQRFEREFDDFCVVQKTAKVIGLQSSRQNAIALLVALLRTGAKPYLILSLGMSAVGTAIRMLCALQMVVVDLTPNGSIRPISTAV